MRARVESPPGSRARLELLERENFVHWVHEPATVAARERSPQRGRYSFDAPQGCSSIRLVPFHRHLHCLVSLASRWAGLSSMKMGGRRTLWFEAQDQL